MDAIQNNDPVIKWVDLSSVGIYLGSYRDAAHGTGLCMLDMSGVHEEKIRALGFAPANGNFSDGVYVRLGEAITPATLRTAFGADAVKGVEGKRSEIHAAFAARVRAKTKMNANAFFAQQRQIGINHLGEVVQESVIGRFIVRHDERGKPQIVREDAFDSAAFLRARDADSLRKIADGFVSRIIVRDEKLRRENVQNLISLSNESGFSDREYQEAIEAAINRLFQSELAKHGATGLDAFDVANRIYIGMPELRERTVNSIANQQYSTPVPMSTLAQALLGAPDNLDGMNVLDPTIGNASLVTMLGGARTCGVEIDEARVAQASEIASVVVHADATQTNFRAAFDQPDGFDFVIANPPFGKLDAKVDVLLPSGSAVPSMETGRLDHLILLRALHARKDQGRAVFITGADSVLEDGKIKGRSRQLLNYLFDHYEVEGVTDVSGELYKKQGAGYPIRLYVIGPRKAAPFQVAAPDTLPVIRTYEDLREWAGKVLAHEQVLDLVAVKPRAKRKKQIENEAGSVIELLGGEVEEAKGEVVAEAVSEAKTDERQESEFQQRYIAFSNVAEPSTMIPANLSGPVYEALARIKDEHGDIDEYVAKELDFAVGDLGKYFQPEQVDALAMIFSAHARDLGFLLADRMGVGKGRTLAGVARRERLNGRIPMFITVKDSLFSDFLERDIAAIDSRHLFTNPLIVNDGSKTVDANGDVVVKSLKRDVYRRHAEAGELPEGTDLIMLTYSQICRRPESHLTSRYVGFLAERYPLALLLDESHNGAGASNTGENLNYMIEALGGRGSVVYSSATPIKGAKNLKLYRKVLPQGMNPDELLDVVQSDPLSLQEALNYEIAAQGCLISRELDSTGIEKSFALSDDVARNRAIGDQMAEILTAMSYLSGDVNRVVTKINKAFLKDFEELDEGSREGERMMASSMNFGSRLYQINRQFLLALKARDVVTHARRALESNKKPIIALQHTGESLLVDFVTKANEVYEDNPDRVQKSFSTVHLTEPVTFKDLMRRYLERIQWVKIQGRYGDVSFEHAAGRAESPEAAEAFENAVKRIYDMIDALPNDLPLTPIDYLRNEFGKDGYTIGEISGRNLQASYLDSGGVMIEPVPGRSDKTRVNRVVREFNNGDCDVLVLTGSGSTGLSVQASPAVGRDVRQRVMIKWEMQPDIAQERQMDGRPDRTGQIVKPEYVIPMTGLPADDRVAMMFNNKNRSLTSSTVANRDSKELIREVPDLLNVVGDQVADELLYEKPALARHLDIALPEDPADRAAKPPLWFINKLTGRISLLRVEEQESLYAELQSRFTELLDKLNAEGRNPLEVQVHEWKARIVSREVFMGEEKKADKRASQLDSALYLTTLEYEKTLNAVRAEEVDQKIAANMDGMVSLGAVDDGRQFAPIADFLTKGRRGILGAHLGRRFASIEEALADKEPNEVKTAHEKIEWLLDNLPRLGYGSVFLEEDLEGKMVPQVVLRVNPPTKVEGYARLSDYLLYTMEPGSDLVRMHTLSSIFAKGGEIERLRFKDHAMVRAEFDNAPNGVVTKRARVLDGNLFEAVSLNLRERLGSKVVYTDASGARQHGVLVRSEISDRKLMSVPERVRDPELLAAVVSSLEGVTTNPDGELGGKEAQFDVTLSKNPNGQIVLRVPGAKSRGGEIYLDPALSVISGKESENKFSLKFTSSGGKMVATVPKYQLVELIRYLTREKVLNFYVRDRAGLNKIREQRKNADCDLGAGVG